MRGVLLVFAGMCFAAAIACCAGSWRTMLGSSFPLGSACMRYGVGSLANTFLPGRAGDAVRVGLFGRIAPGGALAVVGAVAAAGTARWLALLPLGIAGVLGSTLPPVALLAAAAAVLPLGAAWALARRGSRRACALLAPLRAAGPATYAALVAWTCGTLAARIAAAALTGYALGIHDRSRPRFSSSRPSSSRGSFRSRRRTSASRAAPREWRSTRTAHPSTRRSPRASRCTRSRPAPASRSAR